MQLSQGGLLALLQRNLIEVRFKRRTLKAGWPPYRRMVCTNDFGLLNSDFGRQVLHYIPPVRPPKYNWAAKGLVCTWDIFWQNFRMISTETHDVVLVIPTQPFEQFREYFVQYLYPLTQLEKVDIMKK
jgi:hypothetical protein